MAALRKRGKNSGKGGASAPGPSPELESGFGEADQLLAAISCDFSQLSRQLKQIARYVERYRDHIGWDRIQDVADRCDVHPSAVIRFAKHFGFSGYSEMRKVFREESGLPVGQERNYRTRIRGLIASAQGELASADIAEGFIGSSIVGMHEFKRDFHGTEFEEAVSLLTAADTIWVVGARRSFAVAVYLKYALQHTKKRVELLAGLGGMDEGQLRDVGQGHVMLAVTFSPYAEESMHCARIAASRGARLIAITDSKLNPLAALGATTLLVHESSIFGFRSLSNTMCMAQSLFIALAYRCELDFAPPPVDQSSEQSN